MSLELLPEKEYLVTDNIKLVYFLVHKRGIKQTSPNYEDIIQTGMIGLVKAAITYDPDRKTKFSAYAAKCIDNEVLTYIRRSMRKKINTVSLDAPIKEFDSELTVGETLNDDHLPDPIEEMIEQETLKNVFSVILNYLTARKRLIVLYYLTYCSQVRVSDVLGVTRSYVNSVVLDSALQIRHVIDDNISYAEKVSMEKTGNFYKVTFFSRDVSNFNRLIASFREDFELPDFTIDYTKERIILHIPNHPNFFIFMAHLMNRVDESSMIFNNRYINKGSHHRPQKLQIQEQSGHHYEKIKAEESSSYSEQILEYISTLDSFTFADIKNHFPNFNDYTIRGFIMKAKKTKKITQVSWGRFKVS